MMQGYNITMGAGCYMNFNCCILDCAPVKIGKNVRMHACNDACPNGTYVQCGAASPNPISAACPDSDGLHDIAAQKGRSRG